jgi:hypothetical protein
MKEFTFYLLYTVNLRIYPPNIGPSNIMGGGGLYSEVYGLEQIKCKLFHLHPVNFLVSD